MADGGWRMARLRRVNWIGGWRMARLRRVNWIGGWRMARLRRVNLEGGVRTWVTLLVQDMGNTFGIDVVGVGGGYSREWGRVW